MHWLVAFLTILASYLIGSIPFGYLVARWRGVNIFEHGSGNIGATNVGRILGKNFGLLVFVLDFAKGALPVALALLLKPQFKELLWTRGNVEVAAGLTAFLGHLLPIYLRFRGGKGVATGAGVVAVLLPLPALAALLVWFLVVAATYYVSLASILAVFALTAVHLMQPTSRDWLEPRSWFCLVAGSLVIVRHRANVARLISRNENKLKENGIMHQASKCLHVLALGLWFGMSIFFTFIVALSLFNTFESLGKEDARETWFPQPAMYSGVHDEVNGPQEQGTRAAGYAVGPLFRWYFALQGLCGLLALATALPWTRLARSARVHRWRVNLLLIAFILVLIGWPIEQQVSALRIPRNLRTEDYLQEPGNQSKLAAMLEARAAFRQWHTYSVLLNLAVIVCVTAAMALAGNLPVLHTLEPTATASPDASASGLFSNTAEKP